MLKRKNKGMRMEWLWLAVAGMVFLALSNIVLKILVQKTGEASISLSQVLPIIAVIVLFILGAAAYLVFTGSVSAEIVKLALLFAALSTIAFFSISLALRDGKVSIVTALTALTTVVVVVASYFLFNERLALKELAAVALAIATVLVLAL